MVMRPDVIGINMVISPVTVNTTRLGENVKNANPSILIDRGVEPHRIKPMNANLVTVTFMQEDADSTWSCIDSLEVFPEVFATNVDITQLEDIVTTAKKATTGTKRNQ